jgi:lysophospholipase L1-like esterase
MPALLAAVRSAATAHGDAVVLDTSEVLCDPDCDSPALRSDGVHYTPEGARLVGDWLAVRLRDLR